MQDGQTNLAAVVVGRGARMGRMPSGRLSALSGGTALVLVLGMAGQVAAAAVGASAAVAAPDAATVSVGEIVVTATKRNERLLDVPEAITAVSGKALDAVGPVTNTADLISAVPGARFNNLGNPLLSEVSIRGSGTERATGADSSVGLYSDGVYIGFSGNGGRNFTPVDSFDVDHIEVLEGPQGALYGRDAEYGVVNITTVRPQFNNSGWVDDTYNFDTRQNILGGVVNYAINDKFAVRFGGQGYNQSGGFEYNPTNNTYYDQTTGYLFRGQARYSDSKLDIDLLAQRQDLRVPSFYSVYDVPAANTTTGFPGIPTYPKGFFQDPRNIPHNGTDYAKEDVSNVSLFINYDLGWAKLTSSSSWRRINTTQMIDADYVDLATEINTQTLGEKGAYPFAQQNNIGVTNTYYEDLHLAGAPMFDGRFTWLGGIELLSQPQSSEQTTNQNPCATAAAPNPVIGKGVCTGTPTQPGCVSVLPGSTCPTVSSPYGADSLTNSKYTAWAPYVSLTYKLGAGFTIAGDLRYSHDSKSGSNTVYQLYTTLPYPFLTGGTIPASSYHLDSGNTTYTVTLSYKMPWVKDGLLYAKVGSGYRVGGFNFGHSPPLLTGTLPAGVSPAPNYAPVVPTYGNETSTSYEIGFKGSIAPRTYVTLAGYYQVTDNALAGVQDGCAATNACLAANTNYTVNAGTVHGQGIELQFNTALDVLGGVFTLQVNASDQVAKYVSNPSSGPNGQKLNGLPLVGTSIAQNPHYLLDATFNYTHPVTEDVQGFFNLRLHGQWGGVQDPITSAVFFPMDDYQDLDLRAGFDFKQIEAAVIVRNLTDEFHRNAQFQQAGVNTVTGAVVAIPTQMRPNLPRSVALELKYRW